MNFTLSRIARRSKCANAAGSAPAASVTGAEDLAVVGAAEPIEREVVPAPKD